MNWDWLDQRPLLIALAGSNGAGKTTFFEAHLADTGLRFVNADNLAAELGIPPYEAAQLADAIRRTLVAKGESFIFETVFSDPIGEKVHFLEEAVQSGHHVALIFIRIRDVEISRQRVSIRVAQGGHEVPDEKLDARFSRTLANLQRAIEALPLVMIFDNSDLAMPFRHEATWVDGVEQPLGD